MQFQQHRGGINLKRGVYLEVGIYLVIYGKLITQYGRTYLQLIYF